VPPGRIKPVRAVFSIRVYILLRDIPKGDRGGGNVILHFTGEKPGKEEEREGGTENPPILSIFLL